MAPAKDQPVPKSEVKIVRTLAKRVRDIASDPVNLERLRQWTRHNDLQPGPPLVLIEMGGVMSELGQEFPCQCQHPFASGLEGHLRGQIYNFEVLKDDRVIPPYLTCNWHVNFGDYGVQSKKHRGDNAGKLGSYVWEPPLKKLPDDLAKLKPRRPSLDRDGTRKHQAQLEELVGGVLPVQLRGGFWWTMGMTWSAIDLIGLEQLMLVMFDEPAGLHQLMTFLRDDHLAVSEWCEQEGLLTLNNEADYIGSGSVGYTSHLPQPGFKAGQPARRRDLWVLSESQETVGVGPTQFAEFIFPYQQAVADKFGLCYYGCCEPVHTRWEILKGFRNLRKVSVSPWCDETKMAAACGRQYVYCRKPNPTLISTPRWDEAAILADLKKTLTAARDCNLEFAMKDVHTVANEPRRLARWVELARQAIAETR